MSGDLLKLVSSVLSRSTRVQPLQVEDILQQLQGQPGVTKSVLSDIEHKLYKESCSPYSQVEQVEGKLGLFRMKTGEHSKQKKEKAYDDESKYRMKYKKLRQAVKNLVYINYSYAEELKRTRQQIVLRKAEKQYLQMKLRSYKTGRLTPSSQVGKSRPRRAGSGTRAAQAREAKLKKQKDKARAKASSAIAAATTATLERLHKEQTNTVREGPAKRKRLKPGMIRKKLQPIPLDVEGRPIMPINLGGLTITSLGKIITDRPGFHSERYIWPIGFESHRTFFSMYSPGTKCTYTCRILDGGEMPLFEITASDDMSNPIQAGSATACHSTVLKQVNKTRSRDATNTGSGPEFFGFSHPVVMNILQNHSDAQLLTKFHRVQFDDPLGVQNTLIKMPHQQPIQGYPATSIPPGEPGIPDRFQSDKVQAQSFPNLSVSQNLESSSSGSSSADSGSSSDSEESSISGSDVGSQSSDSAADSDNEGSDSGSSSDSNTMVKREGAG